MTWRGRTVLFLVSQCVTLFGSTLVQMAVVWYATLSTASGAWVAAFSVCGYLPQFLVSFAGGVWADRYDRKALIMLSDGAIAAVTLAMVLLMPRIGEGTPLLAGLLAMSVLRSVGAGIQTPAVGAVLPQLVPEAELLRYNGLNAAMQSAVQLAAPAAAGAVLTLAALPATLLIDVLTAAVGIGLLALVPIPRQRRAGAPAPLWADMAAGVRYARRRRQVGGLLALYGLVTFLCVPAGFLAGLLVSRVYGDTYWHLTAVELAGFAGMAAGGLLMSARGGAFGHRRTLAAGLALFGAMAAAMGLVRWFPLYLALMGFYGVALTTVQTALITLLQSHTEEALRGRVFGPLADAVPLEWLMAVSGVALLALAALAGGRGGETAGG